MQAGTTWDHPTNPPHSSFPLARSFAYSGVLRVTPARFELSSRPELLIPEGDEKRSGGTWCFVHWSVSSGYRTPPAKRSSSFQPLGFDSLALRSLDQHQLLTTELGAPLLAGFSQGAGDGEVNGDGQGYPPLGRPHSRFESRLDADLAKRILSIKARLAH